MNSEVFKVEVKEEPIIYEDPPENSIAGSCIPAIFVKEELELDDVESENGNPFVCFHCSQSCPSLSYLKEHIKAEHLLFSASHSSSTNLPASHSLSEVEDVKQEVKQNCLQDLKHKEDTMGNAPYFGEHFLLSSLKLNMTCPHCEFVGDDRDSLKKHIKLKHTERKLHFCSQCDYKSAGRSNLRTHIRSVHTDNRPYKCPHCQYSASSSWTLKNHIAGKHSAKKPFSCDKCDYSCLRPVTLRAHVMARHTNEKAFACPHCDYKSVLLSTLKNHISAKHVKKTYNCPYCEFTTVWPGGVRSHMSSRHVEKRLNCPHCHYTTPRPDTLQNHIAVKHDKTKKFPCPHCDHNATQAGNLRIHILSIHSEKNFSCKEDKCDYVTNTPYKLKQHIINKHTDCKRYVCPFCTYSTVKEQNLKIHVSARHVK